MIFSEKKKSDPVALHAQAEVNKGEKFEQTIVLRKGMIYFELNTLTGEIKPAEFESVHFVVGGHRGVHKRLLLKPGFLHVAAINKKNAERKFKSLVLKLLEQNK